MAHVVPCVTLLRFRVGPIPIYFVSISVTSILNGHSLNIYIFRDFFKNLVFGVHSTPVISKFMKNQALLESNEIRLGI